MVLLSAASVDWEEARRRTEEGDEDHVPV